MLLEGKELLTSWYNKLPENEFKVIGVEEPFILTLPDLYIPIIGYIDLLEEDESGTIIITDFKTSGRSYSNDETDKNLQLTIYQLAAKGNGYRDREILLKFDCLIKTKTPKFEQFWTSRSEVEERRAIKKIKEVWNGIHKEVFVPNDGHWKCKNCGFKKQCDEYLEGG
jgi:putative RecB family exonuclease